jgi:RNA polymerase sigma factor (sigma-70 family)
MDIIESWFKEYSDSLFAYGMKFTTDRELVKDSIQNLFLRIMQHPKLISGIRDVKSYLFVSFRNELFANLRRSKKESSMLEDPSFYNLEINEEDSGEMSNDARNEDAKLKSAVESLSSRQKEALYLRYIKEIPMNRIGDMLGINYQSVRNLIHRAIARLRTLIQ